MPSTNEIRDYFLSHSHWVDPEKTVDTVKAGDPDRPVCKAGVCWMSSIENLRAAAEDGCDLLITHEPTFWEHSRDELKWRTREPGLAKQQLLEETGMVVLRIHDCWDVWPGIGIGDSWAKGLGLTERITNGEASPWHSLYAIPEQSLRDFARHVAERIRPLGEDSVQVIGDPEMRVHRPSTGVGCGGPDQEMVEMGSDVLIVCYDGASYWSVRERLAESGVGVISVEHGTSEMWGMENLAKHLTETFPDVESLYLAEHPRTWTMRG